MSTVASSHTSPPLPVALDAMGGDKGVAEAIRGAVGAARQYGVPLLLVGAREAIERELQAYQIEGLSLEIVETDQVIEMHEHPAQALRGKPRASLKVAIDLVAEGRASSAYSAGNSGAVMAAALFSLRRLRGIERPAFGSAIPSRTGVTFLIDMGANTECKPTYLVQFAAMGVAYMRVAHHLPHPSVGLLSNGTEEEKGTLLTREVYPVLDRSPLNFKGYIEGTDIPNGVVDVAVTDGFTGNVWLKGAEGTVEVILDLLRAELRRSWRTRLGAALAMPAFRAIARRLDFEEQGGVPVLGVNGVVLVGHGRSGHKAICNGLRAAHQLAREGLIDAIAAELDAIDNESASTRGAGLNKDEEQGPVAVAQTGERDDVRAESIRADNAGA